MLHTAYPSTGYRLYQNFESLLDVIYLFSLESGDVLHSSLIHVNKLFLSRVVAQVRKNLPEYGVCMLLGAHQSERPASNLHARSVRQNTHWSPN